MQESLQIQADEVEDPGVAPEGSEAEVETDANGKPRGRATVRDEQSSSNADPSTEGESEETQDADRPDWLPEKFESEEELAKAYQELEKQNSQPADEDADDADEDSPTAEEAVEEAGLDFDQLQQEYMENGELSDETYEALEEAGFPPERVDEYVEGQQARARELTRSIYDAVGGEDAFETMKNWARSNLSREQIEAFDSAVASGNPEMAKLAAQGLRSSFVEANGNPPNLVRGSETTPSSGVKPFGSRAELTRAMGTQEYREDPAYREQVARRLAVTDF